MITSFAIFKRSESGNATVYELFRYERCSRQHRLRMLLSGLKFKCLRQTDHISWVEYLSWRSNKSADFFPTAMYPQHPHPVKVIELWPPPVWQDRIHDIFQLPWERQAWSGRQQWTAHSIDVDEIPPVAIPVPAPLCEEEVLQGWGRCTWIGEQHFHLMKHHHLSHLYWHQPHPMALLMPPQRFRTSTGPTRPPMS